MRPRVNNYKIANLYTSITRSNSRIISSQYITVRTFCEHIQSLLLLFPAHEGVSWGYRGIWEGSQPLLLLTVPLSLTLPQTGKEW